MSHSLGSIFFSGIVVENPLISVIIDLPACITFLMVVFIFCCSLSDVVCFGVGAGANVLTELAVSYNFSFLHGHRMVLYFL